MNIIRILAETTIYSAVLFAAIMIFRKLNYGKLSPVLRFILWFLMLVRLCVPITFDSGVHFLTLPQQQYTENASQQDTLSLQQQTAAIPQQNTLPPQVPSQQESLQFLDTSQTNISEIVKTTSQFNVYDFLTVIWLGGIALLIIWTFHIAAKSSKAIRSKSVLPSPEIEKIYRSCIEEMRIRRRLPLFITQGLDSPALVVSVKPKILLPFSFVKHATDEQISLALCHELMHYKRKDHLVCLLMRILTAVYWFNPVIWLSEKEITSDMETACDNRIVQGMQKEEKAYYANTILSMFSPKSEAPFVLGMALSNTKRLAEKRIRGIYMKSKTKKSVKLASLLLAMILAITCFTTACQPVTVQSAVSLPNGKYEQTKKLNDIVTVKYNADVFQPQSVPQATLKIRDFTDADMQKVADYFLPGQQTYAPWELTKTQLQIEINSLQQKNKELQTKKDAFIAQHAWAAELYQAYQIKGVFLDNNQTVQIKTKYHLSAQDEAAFMDACYEPGINEYLIKMDTEALATAPDTAEKQPAAVQFRFGLNFVYGPVEIGGKLIDFRGNADTCTVWAENTDGTISQVSGFMQFGEQFGSIAYFRTFRPFPEVKPLTMSMDQAQKLADQAARAICPDLTLTDSSIRTYDYVFNFTRKVAGAPIVYDSYADYAYAYQNNNGTRINFYENIEVAVDDGGVKRLEWHTPYTDIQVTNQDAKVISMDEAKQKFEEKILAILVNGKYADINDKANKMDSITLNIDKIKLGLTRIQDNEGNFTLVPTWDFYGNATAYKDGEKQILYRFGQSKGNDSLGTVNALDGTEIKRAGLMQQW